MAYYTLLLLPARIEIPECFQRKRFRAFYLRLRSTQFCSGGVFFSILFVGARVLFFNNFSRHQESQLFSICLIEVLKHIHGKH